MLSPNAKAALRRDRLLIVLEYIALTAIGLWVASFFVRALLLLAIAALVAYALFPAIRWLSRFIPRPVAFVLVYILLLGGLGSLAFLVVTTAIGQIASLINQLSLLLASGSNGTPSPLVKFLEQLGLSQNQITSLNAQLVGQLEGLARSIVPIVTGVVNSLLDVILVIVLSVYLLLDGQRVTNWLATETPLGVRSRVGSFLTILQRVVGGYIRGQLIMSTLIGLLVGIGMLLFRVPDALLLGVLAFILEFIPIFGSLTSGVVCVLIALTQGWLIALFVLIYFIVVHILEGDVVGPRVLSKTIGVHPAVSILALIAGGELFGIVGALFASLAAGLMQAVIKSIYQEWRISNPRQFPVKTPESDVPILETTSIATPEIPRAEP